MVEFIVLQTIWIEMETLKFKIRLSTDYQATAPHVVIKINNDVKFDGELTEKQTIEFDHTLTERNILIIDRQNKPDNEKQDLFIDAISIDGIDLRNLIWHKSIFAHVDGREVIGETWLGLNGTWQLKFNGPFWKYMMDWVNGEV